MTALTVVLLNRDISCFENSYYPDQLVSEKQADQNPHCFPLSLLTQAYKWNATNVTVTNLRGVLLAKCSILN